MKISANRRGAASRSIRRAEARNLQKFIGKALRAPAAPEPPVVAGKLLRGDAISFLNFLRDGACKEFRDVLFGGLETSAGQMVSEFRKALKFHGYYHGQPRKLTNNARTKKQLKKFARRAYRGDPDRRGVVFWERVAWLLWNSYSDLMALRNRAERIKQQEIKRIASIPAKRTERAAYMRRYRVRQDAKRHTKGARYITPEAKQRWREERRSLTASTEVTARKPARGKQKELRQKGELS
jgi:hypothetical protein